MRRQAFDVLVVGHVSLDHLFVTKEKSVRFGAMLDVKEVPVTLAGSGANVAVALARLGVKVGLVGAVGRDPRGDEILKALVAESVDTGLIARVSLAETGLGVTVLPDGTQTPLVLRCRGANDLIEVTEEVQKMLHTTQWLYLTKLTSAFSAQVRLLLDTLGHEATRLAWHPGPPAASLDAGVVTPLLARCDCLFVNEDDARPLTAGAKSHADIERSLRVKGAKTVVLTHGNNEAHALSDDVHLAGKPPTSAAADPRGAGDAFRAAFLAGMVHGTGDHALALQWALTNAASVVSSLTTQRGLLTRADLEEKIRTKKITLERSIVKT